MGASAKSLAKINPPKLANVYSRERLFNLLDDARSEKPVIWINAAAGAGKTTLITDYVNNRKINPIWYQMDSGDSDPASFFYYMGLAVKKHASRHKTPMPVLRPEYLQGLEKFSRSYFRELFGRARKPGLLIIDNYQDCPTDSQLHDALANALEEIPENANIIVISRNEPPAEYARLRASGSIYLFNPNELSLTLDESNAVLQARLGKGDESLELNSQQLSTAHEMTQGWVTGLILMLDQARDDTLPEDIDFSENQVIFDYFAGEIFSHTDTELQDFLVKTALLPVITPEIAEAITGFSRVTRIFNELMRKNYFIIKHGPKLYEYHPLFREFLLDHAHDKLGQYEMIDIQRIGAQHLSEAGHLEAAVQLFKNIQDWHSIARVVAEQGAEMVGAGRHRTMHDWLNAIPEVVVNKTPWLQFWLGVCSQPFNLQIARKYFIKAWEQFKQEENIAGQLNAWLGVVETYIIEWGNFKPLDPWIREMETLLASGVEIPSDELKIRVAAGMFSALMYRQPDHPQLGMWEEQLSNAIGQVKNAYLQMKMGFQLFFYYTVWVGDLAKAGVLAKLLRPGKQQLEPATHTLWLALDGIYLWKCGDHQACLDAIEQGLKLADEADFHLWDNLLYSGGVYSCLSLGQSDKAHQYLTRMAETLNPDRLYDVTHYHYITSRIYLYKGKIHEALEHSEAGLKAAIASGSPYAEALIRTIHAQALFHRKDREKAVAVNNIVRDLATRMKARNMLFIALMSEAEFAFEMNSPRKACNALKEALIIAREQDLIKHAFWWPPIMARMCVKALENDIEVDYVQRVIHERSLVPEAPPVHLDNWPWMIKIFTLGRFSVLINGEPVSSSGTARKKPLELLKVIIALGGRQIDQQKITEMLWPDAEGDSATQSLYTTMHRLRKLLGENAITQQSGFITLDPRYAWVDVWSFERTQNQLNKLLKLVKSAENIEQVSNLSNQLLNLYQDNFLANEAEQAWLLPLQQKLKSRLLTTLTELGDYWIKANELERAVACYRRGIEIDNLAEELYQKIMHAYQKLDRHAEAMATFQLCRKNLSDMLGTSPSAKTIALYKTISAD